MRRGVWVLALVALTASAGAASARADGAAPATATTTTTSTSTTSAATYARLAPSYLPAACVGAGEAAIAEPGRKLLALGTPASAAGPSAYPANAPIVTFDSSTASGSTCGSARVTLEAVSLFGGFVTASTVDAINGKGTVSGLSLGSSPLTLTAGQSTLLGRWGRLTIGTTVGRVTAPLVVLLLKQHYSLPAGTTIFVGFAASAQPVVESKSPQRTGTTPAAGSKTQKNQARPAQGTKKHGRKKKPAPKPLKARPSLGYRPKHYAFPVDGGASYVDTYGANRSDIYDGWHHGDDLFSPLGTPVVAVANGTLSLVGWDRLGGWRLWLTDGKDNSFYYAHLAGYSRWILHHRRVQAGEVLGFLGRTGDAFTTEPHLHFEVHPHLYLDRGYDGAVDPTTYLQKWHVVHVPANEIPRPAKLKAPVGTPRQEAGVVWHELLAARHLLPARESAALTDAIRRPFPSPSQASDAAAPQRRVAAVPLGAHLGGGTWPIVGLVLGILALSAGASFAVRRRLRAES
jgi:murein DD-endopeptidase MepM/ murein hydrolase activator NlpD